MKGIRRKEKAITDLEIMKKILQTSEHVTLALCADNEPYLVTLSHGYDPEQHCLFFHCAQEGKKIEILKKNNIVWGQVLIDKGYIQGSCDHLYATVQFRGKVTFLTELEDKKQALTNMIHKLDDNPLEIMDKQLADKSINRVNIGRIDIEFMSGKEAKEAVISL